MVVSIEEIIRRYLREEMPLAHLREWVAIHQWDLSSEEDETLADEIDVAITHLDDGYGDEEDVRHRLAIVLERHTTMTTRLVVKLDSQARLLRPSSPVSNSSAAETSEPVPLTV